MYKLYKCSTDLRPGATEAESRHIHFVMWKYTTAKFHILHWLLLLLGNSSNPWALPVSCLYCQILRQQEINSDLFRMFDRNWCRLQSLWNCVHEPRLRVPSQNYPLLIFWSTPFCNDVLIECRLTNSFCSLSGTVTVL